MWYDDNKVVVLEYVQYIFFYLSGMQIRIVIMTICVIIATQPTVFTGKLIKKVRVTLATTIALVYKDILFSAKTKNAIIILIASYNHRPDLRRRT